MSPLQSSHKSILRRFVPMAAVICATGYLPPKIHAASWILDGNGNWNTGSNWADGVIANGTGAAADFDLNLGLSRTVTLNMTATVGSFSFTDPISQSSLTIATSGSNNLTLNDADNNVLFTVSQNNTLTINPVINDGSNVVGLTKVGNGTLALAGANIYTGPTTITGGILQASNLQNGGTGSSIGDSSNAAANLVIDGGILRYTGGNATTNRGFTIGTNGATIDASGSGTVNFNGANGAVTAGLNSGDRTLTLRGTNTGTNIMGVVIGDYTGGKTSLVKTDTGTWRLAANNTYTGNTRVERGTLQLDYTTSASRLNDSSKLVLGGLPGGATLDLVTGTHTEIVSSLEIAPGANVIQRTAGGSVLETGAISHLEGGTLRLAADGIVTTKSNTLVNGIVGGWIHRDDNWVTVGATGPNYALNAFSSYTTNTAGTTWLPAQNINLTTGSATLSANTTINSLRFDGAPGTNIRVLIDPSATLTIGTGGILTVSSQDTPRHISGGSLTSGSGELFAIIRRNNTWVDSKITGDIALTKSGSGGLVLFNNNTNDYTGNTYINEGTLFVRSDNALGATSGVTHVNGGNLDFQGVNYTAKEKVYIHAGSILASQVRSIFAGDLISADTGSKAVLNIASWLELNGTLTGQDGFQKAGSGTLIVNGATTLSDSNRYIGSGDIDLNAGVSVWNAPISISGGSLSVTGGQHSIKDTLTLNGGRIVVTGGTLSLTKDNAVYNTDIAHSNNVTTILAGNNQTVTGNVHLAGGSFQTNGSVVINGSFNAVGGNLNQIAFIDPANVPTAVFNGEVTFQTSSGSQNNNSATSNLHHNTTFNGPVTVGTSGTPTLNLVGTAHTTFNDKVELTNGTINFINSTLGSDGYTTFGGTTRFNGLNVVNGVLNLQGTNSRSISFIQEGIRRSEGINAVRDVFNGGITISGVPTSANTVVADFRGFNVVGGDINVSGNAAGGPSGFPSNTVDVVIRNAQEFNGELNLNGGRTYLENGNALGAGYADGGKGVNITGEKSIFMVQRGVATNEGEDIVIGPTTGYVTGFAITNRGSGYTSNPTATLSDGGFSAAATAPALTQSGGFVNSIAFPSTRTLGAGYTSAPTVNITGGGGTGATAVAILSGVVALRANDQHNIWNGNIVLNNVLNGAVTAAPPVISVNSDDSLEINGDIYGSATQVTAGTDSRLLTTATPGGAGNSSSGTFILNGQVKDNVNGAGTGLNVLRTEWGGSQELNVWVNKEWGSNGMITVAQGVMRYTAEKTSSLNFFGPGVTTPSFELSTTNASSIGYNLQSNNAAFFLTKPGQVFNAPSFTVNNGNTDKINNDGTDTGHIIIGGENSSGTVTFGTGTGTITIKTDASSQIRDLRLYANAGGTVDISANLADGGAGTSSITKVGSGTVRLLGSTAGAGTVERAYVLGGTLELAGFNTNADQRTAANAQLHLGGGTLKVTGDGTTALTQNMTGAMTVRNGGSTVQVVDNGTGVTLNLGAAANTLTRSTGGTVRFVETGAGASITLDATAATLTKGRALGWATYGTNADPTHANAATHFARVSTTTGEIQAATGAAADNVDEWFGGDVEEDINGFLGTTAGSVLVDTIRFKANAAGANGVVTIQAGEILTVNQGILVSSLAGGNNRVITGGILQAGHPGTDRRDDLIIHNYGGDGVSTGPSLTIASQITNYNGTNTKGLTIRGDGVTILTNTTNSYTGNTYVSGGTLRIGSQGVLGSTSSDIILDGGTLHVTDDVIFSSSSRDIYVMGDRATLRVDPGKTLTMNGGAFQVEGQALTGYGGNNTFHGDLVIDGGGTVHKIRTSGSDGITGQVAVTGNSRLILEGNQGSLLGTTFSEMDGTRVANGSTIELRPTGNYSTGEFLRVSGAGVDGLGGIQVRRPDGAVTDRDNSWIGRVTLEGNTTIFVDDSSDETSSQAAIFSFNDNIFEGGNFAITKKGSGVLRFVNNRVQNLKTINIEEGEVRFEGGVLGTVGTIDTGNNFFTGTESITVGNGSTERFEKNARLWFADHRGNHSVNITLNGGFLIATPTDAPLQQIDFSGTITLNGAASSNAIEIGGTTRSNPVTMYGPIVGSGGFTKIGTNQLQLVNAGNSFTGELIVIRGGQSQTNPAVGLYDEGRLTGVSAIHLKHDATLHIDNLNGLDDNAANNNNNNRINDSAALYLSSAARLRYLANGSVASSETFGALHVERGSTSIGIDPQKTNGAAKNVSLSFASYNRSHGAVTQFRVREPDVNFGTGTGDNTVNVTLTNAPGSDLYIGGNGGVGTTNRSVVLGAFGGVATNRMASFQNNTTLPYMLQENEQNYIGRHFMTVESSGGKNYLRPLTESEYFKPTVTGVDVDDYYTFDSSYTATNQNVRLVGGFGPFTSYLHESSFGTQGRYEYDVDDNSRRQDSLYRVTSDVTFNTLSFAPQPASFLDGAGNRILMEIDPGRKVNIASGMILNAGYGTLSNDNPTQSQNASQVAYVRGGSLEFGNKEIIIHNVAGHYRETAQTFSGGYGDLYIYSSINGTNGLTKSGPSQVILGGMNTYSGPTTVTEGPLRVERAEALGNTSEVVITGTGEFRMARSIEVNNVPVRFTDVGATNLFRNESGYNRWNGDIQIDSALTGGHVQYSSTLYNTAGTNGQTFVIGGNIYGLFSATTPGATDPFTEIQRSDARLVNLQGEGTPGGIIQLRGHFRDTAAGPITVTSGTENQVLRALVTGSNDHNVFVYNAWDSAGRIYFRQGSVRLMPEAGGTFYSIGAMNALNPYIDQSRAIMADSTGGDANLLLTTAGQSFNSPQLLFGSGSGDASYMIGGENTSGTVRFFNFGTQAGAVSNQFNEVSARTNSTWNRNVRMYANDGGTVEIWGRISDNGTQGSFTKVGRGTVILRGMDKTTAGWSANTSNYNDFDKQIIIAGGTLVLDYDTNDMMAGTTNLTARWGIASTDLVLAGGRIQLIGESERATTQDYTDFIVRPGSSSIILNAGNNGTTGQPITLTIRGVYTQNSSVNSAAATTNGGTVNFVEINNGTGGTASIVLAPNTIASGHNFGGTNSLVGPWATYSNEIGKATSFAFRGSNNEVSAFDSFADKDDPTAWTAGDHVRETAGFSTGTAISGVKTITFQGASGSTLNLPASFTIGNGGTADEGAILIPSGTTGAKTITGNTLTVIGNKSLYVHHYGSGTLAINSQLTGSFNLVKTGDGTMSLGASNTPWSGKTFINGGVLEIDADNKLGAAPSSAVADKLTISGGTLRYTNSASGTIHANRGVTIGGDGATFDVSNATGVMRIAGIIARENNPALQRDSTTSYLARNPFSGDLIKTGPGVLELDATGTNTYAGITHVKDGVLSLTRNNNNLLGTNVSALDGTIVDGGATLRFAHSGGDLTTAEWITFREGSTVEINQTSSARSSNLDGVITLEGAVTVNYNSGPSNTANTAGNSALRFGLGGGYLTGPGDIIKNSVNNGYGGGILEFRESNPEWTGNLHINGGRVIAYSTGKPLGSGNTIFLGTTGAVTSPAVYGAAHLWFSPENAANTNGSASLTGIADSIPMSYAIDQNIVVNKEASGGQTKSLGLSGSGNSLDRFNYNGNITLHDDLQFYFEDDFRNVNTAGDFAYINYNGNISTGSPNGGTGNLSTNVGLYSRPGGFQVGVGNDMHVVFSLNGDNSNFFGNLTVGNATSDPDRSHIVRLGHDKALNSFNNVTLNNESTLQVGGKNVAVGRVTFNTAAGKPEFSSNLSGNTTASITSGSRIIVENAASTPGSLSILADGTEVSWNALFRDGSDPATGNSAPLKLIKDGSAIVNLNQQNLYSGGTIVRAGTLRVNSVAQGSAAGSGMVTVEAQGTLAGNGLVMGANISGMIAPGNTPDIDPRVLTVQGDLTFNAGSQLYMELYGTTPGTSNVGGVDVIGFDQLDVTGTVAFNGRVDLTLDFDTGFYDPVNFVDFFTIILNHGSDAVSFSGVNAGLYYDNRLLTEGSKFRVDTGAFIREFQISYKGGDGNDIVVLAVPEPGTALTLMGGVGMLLGMRRFRRRS